MDHIFKGQFCFVITSGETSELILISLLLYFNTKCC